MYKTTDGSDKHIGIKFTQNDFKTVVRFQAEENCRIVLGFYNYKTEQEIISTKEPKIDDFNFVPDDDIIERNEKCYYRSTGYSVVERIISINKPIFIYHNENIGIPLEIEILVLSYSLDEPKKITDVVNRIHCHQKYQQMTGENDCEYVTYKTTNGTNNKVKIKESIDDGVTVIEIGTQGTYKLVLGFYRYKSNAEIEDNNDFYRIDDFSYIPECDKFFGGDYVYFKASGYNIISKKLKKGDSFCIYHDETSGYPSGINIIVLKKI